MLDRYNRLTYDYKIEIAYDNLIQNIILKGLIIIMSIIISDLNLELELKIIFYIYKWKQSMMFWIFLIK